jgi:shikimate kinase
MGQEVNKTIVLVGLMGAGKTAIGTRLAKHLSVTFVDTDHLIEEKAGKTVSKIFEEQGEKMFRDMERAVIAEEIAKSPHVMATGGGAFMDAATRTLIKQKAISVWLQADLDTLLGRVSRKNTRPLLEKGDKAAVLKELMEKRYPTYAEADIVVESTDGPHQATVDKIIEALSKL